MDVGLSEECAQELQPVYNQLCDKSVSQEDRAALVAAHHIDAPVEPWCEEQCDYARIARQFRESGGAAVGMCLHMQHMLCVGHLHFNPAVKHRVMIGAVPRREVARPPFLTVHHAPAPAEGDDDSDATKRLRRLIAARPADLPPAPAYCATCAEATLNSTDCVQSIRRFMSAMCEDGDELAMCLHPECTSSTEDDALPLLCQNDAIATCWEGVVPIQPGVGRHGRPHIHRAQPDPRYVPDQHHAPMPIPVDDPEHVLARTEEL